MRRVSIVLFALAAMGTLAVPGEAWGGAPPHRAAGSGSLPPAPGGAHVRVYDGYFTPTTVPISRGGTIVFDFVGEGHHTATDDSGLNLYDSGLVDGGGASTSYTFTAAGAYRFTCSPHPSMGGRVEVPVRAAPASGEVRERFTVTWASAPPEEGFVHDVEVHRPGGGWSLWRDGVLGRSKIFRPDGGTGVYRFRARLRNAAGSASFWSLEAQIKVTR